MVKRDLGRVLLTCERLADEAVTAAQAPQDEPEPMSDADRVAALSLLRDPDLAGRITADFAKTGMAGEAVNCLVGYLAAVSRKLPRPLAVIVQSTSAAGKSALMDAVLAFVPAEDRVRFSAMTGQSLFYMGESDLAHKVLAVAEEEGAERAAYALKLLSSDGELSIASTGKDTVSGRLVTHTYTVTGPASIFLTTTAIDVDEELLNRCLVLTVDEGRAQTKAIHDRQRAAQTLDGLLAGIGRDQVMTLHQNAQRLIEPLHVVNPLAGSLAFADATVRARRDHVKYLTLIAAVTLLHQHQRQVKTVTRGGQRDPLRGDHAGRYRAGGPARRRGAGPVAGRAAARHPPSPRRHRRLRDRPVPGRGRGPGSGAVHPPAAPRGPAVRRHAAEGAPGPARRLRAGHPAPHGLTAGSATSWPGSHRLAAAGMRLRPRTGRAAEVGSRSAPGRGAVGPRSAPSGEGE